MCVSRTIIGNMCPVQFSSPASFILWWNPAPLWTTVRRYLTPTRTSCIFSLSHLYTNILGEAKFRTHNSGPHLIRGKCPWHGKTPITYNQWWCGTIGIFDFFAIITAVCNRRTIGSYGDWGSEFFHYHGHLPRVKWVPLLRVAIVAFENQVDFQVKKKERGENSKRSPYGLS